MSLQELANKLQEMYDTAPQGEKVVQVILFGIIYADELWRFSLDAVVEGTDLNRSYAREVHKGRSLAKYVGPKN